MNKNEITNIEKNKKKPTRRRGFFLALRCHRGATAVEFALIFPVFLLILLGVVEAGRAMWIKATMQYICEETSRYALVNPTLTTAQIVSVAETKLATSGFGNQVVTFTATQDLSAGITFMTINASHTFEPLITIIGIPAMAITSSSRVPQNE